MNEGYLTDAMVRLHTALKGAVPERQGTSSSIFACTKYPMLLIEIKHSSYAGDKNSQHGTVWVRNSDGPKKIKRDELESYLLKGWELGRVKPRSQEEIKARTAAGIEKRKKFQNVCANCGKQFLGLQSQASCSKKCGAAVAGPKTSVTRRERDTFSGWHTRKGESSYPEKYMEDVFNQEGIIGWKREKKVGRWFIDFAFEDKMIAVEVDGRQHNDAERANSDVKKDEYLTSLGWKVIRIKWFNPRTEQGKEKLHPQVKSLLAALR